MFWIERSRWRAEWNWTFEEALKNAGVTVPVGYTPPGGEEAFDEPVLVKAGKTFDFQFGWSREEGLKHLEDAGIKVPGFSGSWADYHFEIPCRGEIDGTATLTVSARPHGRH